MSDNIKEGLRSLLNMICVMLAFGIGLGLMYSAFVILIELADKII